MSGFESLNQFYSGAWMAEGNQSSSSHAYILAMKVVYALQQGKIKEYKFLNSTGGVVGANGLYFRLLKN